MLQAAAATIGATPRPSKFTVVTVCAKFLLLSEVQRLSYYFFRFLPSLPFPSFPFPPSPCFFLPSCPPISSFPSLPHDSARGSRGALKAATAGLGRARPTNDFLWEF